MTQPKNSTEWFIPYLQTADRTELFNMLIHATQFFSDERLNQIFPTEREKALGEDSHV